MEATIRPSEILKTAGFWNTSGCIVWTAALLVVIVGTLLLSHRGTSFGTYNLAGLHWIHGENVYTQWMGFVYSPTVAAFFAAFACVPFPLGSILWQLLNAAVLVGGVKAAFNVNLFPCFNPTKFGITHLLIVSPSLLKLDNIPANPLCYGRPLVALLA